MSSEPISIPIPFFNWNLLLFPRWGESAGQFAGTFLSLVPPLVVVGVLVGMLYRYEMRLVKRSAATALLALRLLSLALLVFLLTLQPVLAEPTTETVHGHVVVVVDRSDSIGITDPQRPPLEKLKLARALGIGQDICPREQLDEWIGQYDDPKKLPPQAPPRFVSANDFNPQRAVERRKVYEQLCQKVDELTRTQVARTLLADDGVHLLKSISAQHRVDLIGFGRDSWDGKPDQLNEFFQTDKTAAPGTDLTAPLSRALERSGPDNGKVIGVIFLTDGQHNWSAPGEATPEQKAAELGDKKIPIYPVVLGYGVGPANLAIAGINAPPQMFKEGDLPVTAQVKVAGHPGQQGADRAQEVEVVLERARPQPNGPPTWEALQREVIRHSDGDRTYSVAFKKTRMSEVGTQILRVSARPMDADPVIIKQAFPNSQHTFRVNVADDKAKVLVIDGEARYEFHYLSVLLGRDKSVSLDTVVFDQPRLGRASEEELKRLGHPGLILPDGPDALAPYDCIVLGDVTPEQLPIGERARLERYVADRGGTLVIQAGKRAMPQAFAGGPTEDSDPLMKMLPISRPQVRNTQSDDGLGLELTREGKATQFLEFDSAPDKNLKTWAELPPYYWAVTGEAKPGAVALVSVPAAPGEAVIEGKEDETGERQRALIVRHSYGFGRVIYVGLDSTWRWRYKAGDTKHHRFWGQLIRWAAGDKPLVTGNDFIRFGTRDPSYHEGQEIEFVARLGDSVDALRPGALATARIIKAGSEELVAEVQLKPRDAQPKVLQGRVPQLAAGEYAMELAIPDMADKLTGPPSSDGQPAKLRAPFTVSLPDSPEMIDLGVDENRLIKLAAVSNGEVYKPDNVTALIEKLVKHVETRTISRESKLWQDPGILALFLALVTAEWIARKWAGLP
jgi:hypothetical protein